MKEIISRVVQMGQSLLKDIKEVVQYNPMAKTAVLLIIQRKLFQKQIKPTQILVSFKNISLRLHMLAIYIRLIIYNELIKTFERIY